ncbi:unnamed protein product, partial [Mesorhabditis belari]|uniref:Acyl carrier protein n=1 Tax=Mesorhabditis belari TaxID=2138241 RepID=A0AAF3E841_9BILA
MAARALRVIPRLAQGTISFRSYASCTRTIALPVLDKFCIQKRYSQVNVFGPFDPPKPLTLKEVEQRVLKAVRAWDRFPADKEKLLTMDATFAQDLGFDSLDQVEVTMALEDEFGFEIPLQDAEKLKSPRDVFKYICEREDVFE